jgi:hypothetical protein
VFRRNTTPAVDRVVECSVPDLALPSPRPHDAGSPMKARPVSHATYPSKADVIDDRIPTPGGGTASPAVRPDGDARVTQPSARIGDVDTLSQSGPDWARQCSAAVAELELPQDFSIPALVESVARHYGITIELQPQEVTDPEISGMSVRFADGSYGLAYPVVQEAPWWSLMCVGHELGHISRGHLSRSPRTAEDLLDALSGPVDVPADLEAGLPADLAVDLEVGLSRRYRCLVNRPDELEAELFSTLLTRRIERGDARRARRRRRTGQGHDELTANLAFLLD